MLSERRAPTRLRLGPAGTPVPYIHVRTGVRGERVMVPLRVDNTSHGSPPPVPNALQ